MTRVGETQHCSACGQTGHNRRTCSGFGSKLTATCVKVEPYVPPMTLADKVKKFTDTWESDDCEPIVEFVEPALEPTMCVRCDKKFGIIHSKKHCGPVCFGCEHRRVKKSPTKKIRLIVKTEERIVKKQYKCSVCGEHGHNKRTCPQVQVPVNREDEFIEWVEIPAHIEEAIEAKLAEEAVPEVPAALDDIINEASKILTEIEDMATELQRCYNCDQETPVADMTWSVKWEGKVCEECADRCECCEVKDGETDKNGNPAELRECEACEEIFCSSCNNVSQVGDYNLCPDCKEERHPELEIVGFGHKDADGLGTYGFTQDECVWVQCPDDACECAGMYIPSNLKYDGEDEQKHEVQQEERDAWFESLHEMAESDGILHTEDIEEGKKQGRWESQNSYNPWKNEEPTEPVRVQVFGHLVHIPEERRVGEVREVEQRDGRMVAMGAGKTCCDAMTREILDYKYYICEEYENGNSHEPQFYPYGGYCYCWDNGDAHDEKNKKENEE